MGDKLDDIDYFTFSKLILPVIFIISPFIVFYYIFKKEKSKIVKQVEKSKDR